MVNRIKIYRLLLSSILLTLISFCAYAKIEIKSIEVSGNDIPITDQIVTDYNQNTISFHLNGDGKIQQYRQGLIKFGKFEFENWIEVKENYFKLKRLSTGNFRIEIREASNPSETVNFEIFIKRPWWRTWWFWGASFITLFGLFYSRERLLKQWEDDEKTHHRQIVELELKTLQLQMNPHFIFNALNSIQSYVLNHDSLTANNYLSKFAHLIRLFLDSSRSKYISLKEEIRLLNLYCDMETMRFEDKFTHELIIDKNVDSNFELPTMILQPFVENAINHGLRYKKEKGHLSIRFSENDQHVICEIKDNGVGRKAATKILNKPKKGYKSQGLNITSERLKTYNMINNSEIEHSIEDLYDETENEEVGTIVIVKFPI